MLDEHNPGSWPNVFREFGVRGSLCESLGKLESLLERDLQKFTTVFIDESHRFRTEDTQSYEMLAQICRGKRVVLVSATPLNNTPQDILSQIKLFQPGKNSTIPNVRNLEAFFGEAAAASSKGWTASATARNTSRSSRKTPGRPARKSSSS